MLRDVIENPDRRWRIAWWTVLVATAVITALLDMSAVWAALPILIVLALRVYYAIADARARAKRRREEPIAVWIIELDRKVVGLLTAPWFVEMFWRGFVATPLDGSDAIYDDELWSHSRFTFRHGISGRRAHAYAGRTRPTREVPFVTMRGLW